MKVKSVGKTAVATYTVVGSFTNKTQKGFFVNVGSDWEYLGYYDEIEIPGLGGKWEIVARLIGNVVGAVRV